MGEGEEGGGEGERVGEGREWKGRGGRHWLDPGQLTMLLVQRLTQDLLLVQRLTRDLLLIALKGHVYIAYTHQ